MRHKQILTLTDAGENNLNNATAGNSICLLGNGSTTWYAVLYEGTWTDAN